jgi:hypothetical protein
MPVGSLKFKMLVQNVSNGCGSFSNASTGIAVNVAQAIINTLRKIDGI